jgi:hypothetical protein
MLTFSFTPEWQNLGDGFEGRYVQEDNTDVVYFRQGHLKAKFEIDERDFAEFSAEELNALVDQRLSDFKKSVAWRRASGQLDDYDESGFLRNYE